MVAVVRLRPLRSTDVAPLDAAANDPDGAGTYAWYGYGPPSNLAQRLSRDELITEHNGHLAIETDDGALAGSVSWHARDNGPPPNGRCWMIGIAVLPEHRGHGVGTAAQREMVRYLFQHTAAVRVEAGTEAGNTAERIALERAGFRHEGTLRQACFRDGQWRDMTVYSVLRSELGSDAAS